jgi:hypothetical protein
VAFDDWFELVRPRVELLSEPAGPAAWEPLD